MCVVFGFQRQKLLKLIQYWLPTLSSSVLFLCVSSHLGRAVLRVLFCVILSKMCDLSKPRTQCLWDLDFVASMLERYFCILFEKICFHLCLRHLLHLCPKFLLWLRKKYLIGKILLHLCQKNCFASLLKSFCYIFVGKILLQLCQKHCFTSLSERLGCNFARNIFVHLCRKHFFASVSERFCCIFVGKNL